MIKKTISDDSSYEDMAMYLGEDLKKVIGRVIDKKLLAIIEQLRCEVMKYENDLNWKETERVAASIQVERLKFALMQIEKYPIDRPIQAIIKKALK